MIEVRGHTVWERAARNRNRGRVRLLETCSDPQAAQQRGREIAAEMVREGWVLVDPDAGIDQLRPKGALTKTKRRLSADELRRELERTLRGLDSAPTQMSLLDAFAAVVKQPLRPHRQGFLFEVVPQEEGRNALVSLRLRIPASAGHSREIGFCSQVEIHDDREAVDDVLDIEGSDVDLFVREVQASDAYGAIADLPSLHTTVDDLDFD